MIKKIIIALSTILLLTACEQTQEAETGNNWYDALPRESWSRFEKIDVGDNWFEVYKLTDNTYAIYEPYQWQEAISYLLIGGEKALLVDTLQGISDLKAVVDQLTSLPVIVINTHTHYDHTSGNHQFETIYGLDNPYTAENAKGHKNSEIGSSMTMNTIWKNLPDGFNISNYESKPFEIDHFVADGEIIDLGGREIEIAYIPGHSPDSIILVDKQNRMMLTGDSFYPAPIYVYSETSSFEDYFMASQIMFGYQNDVDYLLPGHNETMQPASYLNRLRQATMDILNPTTPFAQGQDVRSYDFGDFSIIVKDPLDFGID
ncbi:MBL fold metallo-hydrolase [Pseudemcibacter aquimaris]|uniref:MBL fold metallo-hydrolase n=1 Tax=Pseudemcibacter aquimaris TaxID=2857064 RepID=UPI00201214F5|nr:MBL fold metallo-hydrolase [Pseudemcibacter aquimaris]MCC3859633.1 MBL fold metallo-hydrolase [Pseudemcibacter aquimaris]WDU60029.1 MBL fold metallo-hydrolase [Pseudemcibacter aquimaris]